MLSTTNTNTSTSTKHKLPTTTTTNDNNIAPLKALRSPPSRAALRPSPQPQASKPEFQRTNIFDIRSERS